MDTRKFTPEQLHELRRSKARPENLMRMTKCDAVVYLYTTANGRPVGRAYVGKAIKPAWNWSFKNLEQLHKHIRDWSQNLADAAAEKAKRAEAKKAFRHTLKVGDILRCSWGYEQTNIDYYQITQLHGEHMVSAREIGADTEDTLWLQGRSVPCPGKFIGAEFRARVQQGNMIRITSYSYASPLEYQEIAGARVYQSSAWTAYA